MPAGSSPYYIFGAQRRYPYAWHGGAGGVPYQTRSAESRSLGSLGSADMIESGLDPNFLPSPAFRRTQLHNSSTATVLQGVGDWPLLRPSGPEPIDPNSGTRALGPVAGIPFIDGLSDNEKIAAVVITAGVAAFLYVRSKKKRGTSNPSRTRARYFVYVNGRKSIGFGSKSAAETYANQCRRDGYSCSVRPA